MKAKINEAVLNHTQTSVAVLTGGCTGSAALYAPDVGALYLTGNKELRPIPEGHAHKIKGFWDELSKSTDMTVLIVRNDGHLGTLKKLLRQYREEAAESSKTAAPKA